MNQIDNGNLPNLDIINVSEVEENLLRRFSCKEDSLARYLKEFAKSYHNAGAGATNVVINQDNNEIIGYYTLKCSCVKVHDPEMSEEEKYFPAIEISRFAIKRTYEGKGWGKGIFSLALSEIDKLKKNSIGVQMIILFALPDVTGFYNKFNFKELDATMATYECKDNEDCICMYARA